MASIPGVANNELIRTTWGNSVATELNTNVVKKDATAAQSIAGPVTVAGLITANNQIAITDTPPTAANHATRKDYVDSTTVGIAGDTMTGMLIVNPASGNECIRLRSSTPELTLYNEAGTSEYGHLAASGGGINLLSINDLSLSTNNTIRMSIVGANVLVGKTASSVATGGIELLGGTGEIITTVETNIPNLICNRTGTGDVDGGVFTSFRNVNVVKGSITWDSGTGKVKYNETSDYRIKNDLGPITDGVERIKALRPRRITRIDVPDSAEQDAFLAHEVQAVVPEAVTGVKDAVAGPPPVGEPPELYPVEGSPILQQLDYSALVTVTIAALQDALAQIDTLTARVAALEGVTP